MSNQNWNRRDLLKAMGLATLGAAVGSKSLHANSVETFTIPGFQNDGKKPDRPVKVIVIGAGSRGWGSYSSYARRFPDELEIVGVAEPIPFRRERMANAFNIPKENQFVTWEHVFDKPRFADALFITTPDDLHYGPSMAGLNMGYDLLLEKPIAQTWQECKDILELAEKKGSIVAVCHVLRYTPYFRKMKEIVDSGEIGDLISIKHTELIEHIHMSHSYVRGLWNNSETSNPIILSKSCHDTDIIRWMTDQPCTRTSSFGSLSHFHEGNAPEGSTPRCTDGCKVERECPYSAIKIYRERRIWLYHMPVEEFTDETITQQLKTGQFGRCVYRCDNNVPDHQITNFEFEKGITAAFSMEGITYDAGRHTRIFGSKGDITGDERTLRVTNFSKRKDYVWDASEAFQFASGHGGGDHGLVHDFVRAVAFQQPDILSSTIQVSMASHLMAFQAEESRLKGTVEEVGL
jgi:predicted dehydrogenase